MSSPGTFGVDFDKVIDKIDARVDLYATGVLLFEMLAGRKPFVGEDAYAVLVMQRDMPPPMLRSIEPDVSPELERVVSRALEKDVDKRFQTAAEFIAAIDAVPEATGRPSAIAPAEQPLLARPPRRAH